MNAPGLNFTGIHARSPETTATRRHDLGPLADRRRGNPARIALHRRRTAGGRRIRRPPPPARIPGLACAVARAAARSTRGARSGRRSRISFPVIRPEYSGEHTGRAPAPAKLHTARHRPAQKRPIRKHSIPTHPVRRPAANGRVRPAAPHRRQPFARLRGGHSCAVDIEPADSDFSRAARRFISPQEQALQPCALPEALFPALVWCAKEAVYKWVRISGLSLLHDIRITEIHPETTRTNPSGTGFPALEAFHRLTVTAAGKTLQLHGFTVEGICCVYGIG